MSSAPKIKLGPFCIANYITTPLVERDYDIDSYRPLIARDKVYAYEFKNEDGTWPSDSDKYKRKA